MNIECLECIRLLQESNDAISSHTEILGRIYGAGNDHEITMRMKLKPDAREASDLRKSTRQAFDDHQVTHEDETVVRYPLKTRPDGRA